ncbi:MAG TPA: hypothetical protein PLG31_10485 [Spirochaetota bacterium]|nr:hypothetical protein [Spirochaetota bacterium]HPU90372.1 hypothetical protein [Spirochaetota bacterium]
MSDNIRTITDRTLFEKIFYKFFMGNPVFIKTKSGNLKIRFFGYSEGLVALNISLLKNAPDTCLIFTKHQDYLVYAHLKFAEKQEETIYLFHALKMQIITATRREDRVALVDADGEGGKRIVYLSNVISDFIIENSLAMTQKKVDHIKEMMRYDLQKQFEYLKIFFINEGTTDPRMKQFIEDVTPIYIANLNEKPKEKYEKAFNSYINEIYSRDYYLRNRKNFISEITVPILYRMKVPYGYIQVNGSNPFPESALTVIKRMAIVIEELFTKDKIFPVSDERLLVSDVSKRGLGVAFRERRFIRYFKEKSMVYFDLFLPDGKRASILGVVRNISLLENKIIKVGCEFITIDPVGEVNLDEFLESIGQPTE